MVERGELPADAAAWARLIDHTLLKADATEAAISRLCAEALEHGFAAVCINPAWVRLCAETLGGSSVAVCTVIGFPLGATLPEVKVYEAHQAISAGAHELDMVIQIGALKSGDRFLVERDIRGVAQAAHARGAILKTIIETSLLTQEEKVAACELAGLAGADFVKTSTGFGPGGATAEDVALMRGVVGDAMGVKAAGGIRSLDAARRMIQAGASRIGTSSGVQIVRQAMEAPGAG